MAAIKFSIKIQKKNQLSVNKGVVKQKSIYVRMYHSRLFDFERPISIYVDPKNFDAKNQCVKRSIYVEHHEQINKSLDGLKNHLFAQFNIGMITGQEFDRKWFDDTVLSFFNRTVVNTKTELHKIYFTDWCTYWLQNFADTHKVSSTKLMSEATKNHYVNFEKLFREYQGKKKMKFSQLTNETLDAFSLWLTDSKKYSFETTSRHLRRLTFFIEQAEIKDIKVNKDYKQTIFVKNESKKSYTEPYLSLKEIDRLFNLDLSENEDLDHARDNLIISVWTGLRISDFSRLDIGNIKEDYIEIKSTKKTGVPVTIPIHKQVKYILDKRNGSLPIFTQEPTYNRQIKVVAQKAGMTEEIIGGKVLVVKDDSGNKARRKVIGKYKKWELVTSHIGRRSFATNLFEKVPNSVIMAAGGWKSETMMLSYIKKTKQEHAVELKKHWDSEESLLKVV